MPIYEYRCAACGHQQEFLQKVSDAPMTVCTKCGKPSFEKMVTAAGFQLKGSGWYATDFKNSGSKPATTVPPAKPAGDSKSSDAKPSTDAKPAAESKPASEGSSAPSTPPSSPPASK